MSTQQILSFQTLPLQKTWQHRFLDRLNIFLIRFIKLVLVTVHPTYLHACENHYAFYFLNKIHLFFTILISELFFNDVMSIKILN